MTALKLDGSGDLALGSGRFALVSGADETAQRLRTKLRFFLGEWFLDTRLGLPYFEEILEKNPSLSVIRARLRKTILGDEGVESLNTLQLDLDSAHRTLTVSFEAKLIDGSPLSFSDFILMEGAT